MRFDVVPVRDADQSDAVALGHAGWQRFEDA